jgi:hypothetical protein
MTGGKEHMHINNKGHNSNITRFSPFFFYMTSQRRKGQKGQNFPMLNRQNSMGTA